MGLRPPDCLLGVVGLPVSVGLPFVLPAGHPQAQFLVPDGVWVGTGRGVVGDGAAQVGSLPVDDLLVSQRVGRGLPELGFLPKSDVAMSFCEPRS